MYSLLNINCCSKCAVFFQKLWMKILKMTIVVRAVVGACQVAVHIWRLLPIPRRRSRLPESSSASPFVTMQRKELLMSLSATNSPQKTFCFFTFGFSSKSTLPLHVWPYHISPCSGDWHWVYFGGWYILIPISPVFSSPPGTHGRGLSQIAPSSVAIVSLA